MDRTITYHPHIGRFDKDPDKGFENIAIQFSLPTGDHGDGPYPGTVGDPRGVEMGPAHQLAIELHHGIDVAVHQLSEQFSNGQPFLPGNFLFTDVDHLFHT